MPRYEVVWPKGVGYRTAPHLDAKAEDHVAAKRGEVLAGEELRQEPGWIHISSNGFYLPKQTPDGRPLLRKLPDFVPWQGEAVADAIEEAHPGPAGKQSASDELEALHQRYDKKYGKSRSSQQSGPGPLHPAASHERATAYMHEFRHGLEAMGVDTSNDPYLNVYAPAKAGPPTVTRPPSGQGPLDRSSSKGSVGAANIRMNPRSSAGGASAGGAPLALCGAMVITRTASSGHASTWKDGPQNAIVPVSQWTSVKHGREVQNTCSSGRVVDLSDRNIMCMSVFGDRAVFGSADHGLKEADVRSGRVTRTLYSKRCGHSEWVTTVSHCPDGRVISGGLDSKLCLWMSSGVNCVDLTGHLGSVSKVRTHASKNLAISSGYDKTLRAWDLHSKREIACCQGHTAPILDFVWAEDVVASGDRGGSVMLWDVASAKHMGTLKGHKGHITAMLSLPHNSVSAGASSATASTKQDLAGGPQHLIATGAQDGHIRIWDLRQKLNAFNMSAHVGGAVNDIGITMGAGAPVLVSIGADGRLLILDPRANFNPLFEHAGFSEDFLYSLLVLDDVAFTGDGRGKVTCFDIRSGDQRYVLDAGTNAIRCLGATESSLVCAGDDGNGIIFDF